MAAPCCHFFLHMTSRRFKDGLIASGLHLTISVVIAVIVYLLVQRTWFLPPWAQLLDGKVLFAMIIGVDVVCGPLLTGLVVHSGKARWKNVFDLVVIASMQLGALGYGMWTAWQAKPSWLVFETDRFVLVRYADLLRPESSSQSNLPAPSFAGLQIKAVQKLPGEDPLFLPSLSLSLQGIPPAFRPGRWVDYDQAVDTVAQVALHRPQWAVSLRSSEKGAYPLQPGGVFPQMSAVRFVPLQVGWHTDWVVLVDAASFQPLAVMQADVWADTSQTE